MIEAWQIEHRPWLYAVLRRFELLRWAMRKKMFATQRARLRALLLTLRGHETEICSECGRGVACVWWCEDSALWERVTGWAGGGGVCCPDCFERMARRKGIYLRWRVGLLDVCTARPRNEGELQDVVPEAERRNEERKM